MKQDFRIGDNVYRAAAVRPWQRRPGDPVHRPLWVYSTDPADSRLDGTRVRILVPYEPLKPGPTGRLFEIVGTDLDTLITQPPIHLDDPRLVVTDGLAPSSTSAQFQMQMTYAVAMATWAAFRTALGRNPNWGFGDRDATEPSRLTIFPAFKKMKNAFYDQGQGAVCFGWFVADENPSGRNIGQGHVYTSLSHDIIAHEVAHALLDGMRPNFLLPFHRDTLALHEAFSDLVAVFQHFTHRELVQTAMQRTQGDLQMSQLLTSIARQFGHTSSNEGKPLRTAVQTEVCRNGVCDLAERPLRYSEASEIHQLGSILVSAIFEAFTVIFKRKTRQLIKLATGGSGVLPPGDISDTLTEMLAKVASELAGQFLSICIRAIDYCPPAAVTFGDYLRAMITADYDLVPDDKYGYREALVDAFIRRQIPIRNVQTLSETSLLWTNRDEPLRAEFLEIVQSEADEFRLASKDRSTRYVTRARRVGEYLVGTNDWDRLNLTNPDAPENAGENVEPPTIQSARVSRRVGPDGTLEIDLVVEITQAVNRMDGGRIVRVVQGSTLIIDVFRRRVRYIIGRSAEECLIRPDGLSEDPLLRQFWTDDGTSRVACSDVYLHLHGHSEVGRQP